MGSVEFGPVSTEFLGAELGDSRLEERALKVVEALAAAPDESFPTQTSDDGELEDLYRFLNNGRGESELLRAPHYGETSRGATAEKNVIVIHDTTGFSFGGETRRKGLGRMKSGGPNGSQGFDAHVALVAASETGVPLGVIGGVPVFSHEAPIPSP